MFDELITLYRFLELYRRRLKEKAATDSPSLPEVTHNCFHMNPFIFQSGNRYWFRLNFIRITVARFRSRLLYLLDVFQVIGKL